MIGLFSAGFQAIRRSLTAVIVSALGVAVSAMNPVDSLKQELTKVHTSADSVPVLLNLYDAVRFTERGPVLDEIYQTAKRAGNNQAMYEAIFLMAAFYEEDSTKEAELLKMADAITDSDARHRIKLYVKVRYSAFEIRGLSENERRSRLVESISRYKDNRKLDRYDRMEYLFCLCSYLRNMTDSELLVSYLKELQELIEKLPPEELPLRALFYSNAALCFFNNGLYEEAVDANKKMLEVNGRFDKRHEAQGRIYRNYDGSTYRCYYNMLMCYEVLTDEEIDAYYKRLCEIENSNERLSANHWLQDESCIVYLMAKKHYDEAIPLIEKQLDAENSVSSYNYFVRLLAKAARETGDENALLHALQIRNVLLRQRLEANSDMDLHELQTIYEVNRLKKKNKGLANEQHAMDVEHRKKLFDWVIVGSGLLVVCLVWLLVMYKRSRLLAKKLYNSHRKFLKERNALKTAQRDLIKARDKAKGADKVKNDFVNNMSKELRNPLAAIAEYSHLITDYASEDKRAYINDYSDKLDLNTDMLLTLVNDVLELPSMENGKMSVRVSSTSVQSLCRFTLDLVEKHVAPGVELIFVNEHEEDVQIAADSNKIEQILLHMLLNAAKFTREGTITFGYELADDRSAITFTVTDTGIGIPRGQEDAIFERFHKVDPTTQGNGLGLYIGRMLAELLQGSLTIDKEYRTGARFVLTIPLD
ncbi:MAG: HAMP domain-containing histidine kinase [Muribaculaceae bacterium]|nr:HAMP domain-containing histidine kinase [Muribaculaceae bacterium]